MSETVLYLLNVPHIERIVVNAGTGMKFPKCLKNYVAYGIPAIIIVIYLKGYYDKFAGLGTAALAGWMIVALVLLGFVFYCATAKKKVKQ